MHVNSVEHLKNSQQNGMIDTSQQIKTSLNIASCNVASQIPYIYLYSCQVVIFLHIFVEHTFTWQQTCNVNPQNHFLTPKLSPVVQCALLFFSNLDQPYHIIQPIQSNPFFFVSFCRSRLGCRNIEVVQFVKLILFRWHRDHLAGRQGHNITF